MPVSEQKQENRNRQNSAYYQKIQISGYLSNTLLGRSSNMVHDISNTPLNVIEKMTDQELRDLLKEDMDMGLGMSIIREMSARDMKRLSKPHWSVTPLFWVSVVAAVAACIAAYPVLFPPQAQQVKGETSKPHVQSQQLQSPQQAGAKR